MELAEAEVEMGAGPIVIAAFVVGAFVVASIAAAKGYSFFGFLLAALLVFPIALIIVLVVSDKSVGVNAGSSIRVKSTVKLDDGNRIPAGYVTQVLEVSIIDGTPVARVKAPDGTDRWIAKKNAALV